jgi:hypothetical protein
MQFSGYWVSAADSSLEVSSSTFDETELSHHSNCQEAWQNDDPGLAHGFIDSAAMLDEVCRRLVQWVLSNALSRKRVFIAQADAGDRISFHN